MPKVVHFELPFDDADRANKFYADVFGWESSKFGTPRNITCNKPAATTNPTALEGR